MPHLPKDGMVPIQISGLKVRLVERTRHADQERHKPAEGERPAPQLRHSTARRSHFGQ
jgi:hypothetical protein